MNQNTKKKVVDEPKLTCIAKQADVMDLFNKAKPNTPKMIATVDVQATKQSNHNK